jgi:cytoskeletal protein RodZ
MALEDMNNLDDSPDNSGAEKSNRTFRWLMLGGIVVSVLGLMLIAAMFIRGQGERAQIAEQNAAVEATNAAVATAAAITPVPPTETPTSTAAPATATLPPTATPTKPAPTMTPTPTGVDEATAEPAASGTTATATATPAAGAAAKPVTTTGSITSTTSMTGTLAGGETQVPKTGAGDSLGLIALAAGLVGVFFVARRLRTAQA